MDSNINLKQTEAIFKKGVDALKTSFFKFKFQPDYLSGVSYFTDAGINYKKLKYFKESIISFNQAIICNQHLNERYAEGKNQIELADIYIFELKDNNEGLKCIEQAVYSYKVAGKFSMGVKIYLDFAEKCMNNLNGEFAMKLYKMCFEDCYEFTHDDLARITLEEGVSKLVDCFSLYNKHAEALDYINKYIKKQLSLNNERKNKITKNYVKTIMIRLILKEDFVCDDIVSAMYNTYDSGCGDDIEDAKHLIKAFKEVNNKKFNDLMKYSFDFYENNLLKNLRKSYEQRVKDEEQGFQVEKPMSKSEINEIFPEKEEVIEETVKKDQQVGGNFADELI